MKHSLLLLIACFWALTSNAQRLKQHLCAAGKTNGHPVGIEKVNGWYVQLGDDYDVNYYAFDLSVSDTSVSVSGNVFCKATVAKTPMDTFWFELVSSIPVDSFFFNGVQKPVIRVGDAGFVPLGTTLPVGTSFTTKTYYRGNQAGSGFFSAVSTARNRTYNHRVTWTLSEPFGAPQWWPCKQDLNDKIDSVDFHATAALPVRVGSNGLLVGVDTLGNGLVKYRWKHRYNIDFYLIMFAASKYLDYVNYAHPAAMAPDSLPIHHWVYDASSPTGTNLSSLVSVLNKTPDMIEKYSTWFGLYPYSLEKYGHLQAELGGGMEHQTMTTIGAFGTDIVAHELGHQWFGDWVTCATWNDIWVNEGSASYVEYLYRESNNFGSAQNWMSDAHNYITSQNDGSVYVPYGAGEWRIFDSRTTYKKGAAVWHMLRYQLGDSMFYAVVKNYFQTFGYSTATTDSLNALVNRMTGKNYTPFFQEWIYGEGFPTYNITWNYIPSKGMIYFKNTQVASMPTVTSGYSIKVPVVVSINGVDYEFRLDSTMSVQQFSIPAAPTSVTFDPKNWILDGGSSINQDSKLGPVGVNELTPAYLSVFPNPATSTIFLKNSGLKSSVYSILDSKGQVVKKGYLPAGVQVVEDVDQLSAGVYFIRMETGQVVKWIKYNP